MRFVPPPVRRPQSLLARVLAAVAAVIVLGASIVLGAIALGILLVGGIAWLIWFRWKLHRLRKQSGEHAVPAPDGVIEGEYVVVHERRTPSASPHGTE